MQQSIAGKEQVGQRSAHLQPIQVLGQAAVAHLLEAEHALHDVDAVFDFRAHRGLATIARLDPLIDRDSPAIASVGEITGTGHGLADRVLLPLVGLITPYARLFAMQQVWQRIVIGQV